MRLLPEGKDGGHLYMRNARRLANGNYLVAHYGAPGGQGVRCRRQSGVEIAAPGGPHSAVRLPNGNTLIACGDWQAGRGVRSGHGRQTVWKSAATSCLASA